MNHSQAATKLAMDYEGLSLKGYQDVVGVWTIGWGHTKGVKRGDTCTREQAEVWLDCDLLNADACINRLVTAPLEQEQFDALVDFVFNLGCGSLDHSTLLRKVNACDWDGAAAELPLWVHAGGHVIDGLVRRRAAEAALFMSAPHVRAVPTSEQIMQAVEENGNVG